MTRFTTSFRKLAPSWLTTGEGELVRFSLGLQLNQACDRAYQATRARMPAYAPIDANGPMGRDRKIVRGIDEPAAAYAERMIRWLDDHKTRGNPFALAKQLRAYCQADVMIRTVDRRGNWFTIEADGTQAMSLATGNWLWDTTAASPQWARFWVIIYPTAAGLPWTVGPRWGDADAIYSASRTWGTSATPEQVAAVRSIVREWKPAGTRCESIIIAFDPASFDPAAPEPDGTWSLWSKGDPRVKNRLDTARYWKGTGP